MPNKTVKEGDTILIDFTLRLENGAVVGTTLDSNPAEITIGQGDVIYGIEKAVLGMQEGQLQTISIESQDAFGPYDNDLVQEIDRTCVPNAAKLTSGQIIELNTDTQEQISAMVLEISHKSIKVDANHQLAGKNLIVDLKIIEILKRKV